MGGLQQKKWIAPLLPVALLTLLSGCGVHNGTATTSPTQPPPSQPPPAAGQNGSVTIDPQYAAVEPGGSIHFQGVSSDGVQLQWQVNGVAGGGAATGTVDNSGNYTAPASLPLSENVTVTAALASSPQQNYATAVVSVINPGTVSATANPQVAVYSIYLPAPGRASIEFGKTTDYGLNSWQVATPSPNGGQVKVYVGGMTGQSLYHMRAQVSLADGATLNDADNTFSTGTPPVTSTVQASTTSGQVPQAGIEMWNTLLPAEPAQAFATDLSGNVIWTYTFQGSPLDLLQGIQLLPNGHFLLLISYLSSLTAAAANRDAGTIDVIREVDLAGNTIRELSMDTLNKSLAAKGYNYALKNFHHNVLALPNGHWVLLTAYPKAFTNLSGYSGSVTVLGDVLVDVDENFNPDWVWDTFDHLDINRRPMNFPDWTHSNDLLYSTDDHNLLLSMRHQNWVVKIDFADGQGSGKILWRLGEGGDFKLVGGTDPTDWFYAQHGMSYFTPNTTGVFRIGLMDNGNDRDFPSGRVTCKPNQPTTAQCYSTLPVLEINENTMTASLVVHYVPPPSYFSFFGGNAEQLANGDIHVDFCAPLSGAIVQELDGKGSQLVWQGTTPKADQFHVDRLPSLYPGVQW
jgi:arylsulfate sulfotransferase